MAASTSQREQPGAPAPCSRGAPSSVAFSPARNCSACAAFSLLMMLLASCRLDEVVPRSYRLFTFVREPLARFISAYGEISRRAARPSRYGASSPPRPGSALAMECEDRRSRFGAFVEEMARGSFVHESAFHAAPQAARLADTLGPNRTFAYIGRFESLCTDLDALLKEVLGLDAARIHRAQKLADQFLNQCSRCRGDAPTCYSPAGGPPRTTAVKHDTVTGGGCDYVRDASGAVLQPSKEATETLHSLLRADFACFAPQDLDQRSLLHQVGIS